MLPRTNRPRVPFIHKTGGCNHQRGGGTPKPGAVRDVRTHKSVRGRKRYLRVEGDTQCNVCEGGTAKMNIKPSRPETGRGDKRRGQTVCLGTEPSTDHCSKPILQKGGRGEKRKYLSASKSANEVGRY